MSGTCSGDMLASEYRKLASKFKEGVILVTLGHDFAFTHYDDFKDNHHNYQLLFAYFRQAHPDIHVRYL